jgi:hypothetical protein
MASSGRSIDYRQRGRTCELDSSVDEGMYHDEDLS